MNPSPTTRPQILNRDLDARKDSIAREFATAEPFRHAVIEDFLAPGLAEQLVTDFPSFQEEYAIDETGDVGKKAEHRDVRDISDAYRELDDFIQTDEFLDFISEITGIPGLMYDSEYHGGGTHENVHGASLYTHVDFNYHPRGWHRRLNLIVYLSPEWEARWGGNLELHSNPWDPDNDEARMVPTKFNQAVLFETTESSWHGFSVIRLPEDRRHLSRKSFAIYLYTQDRPADQTAPSHSTIYVPFGIPDEVTPGKELTERQYRLLGSRFDKFRTMLRLQYERQLRLSEDYRAGYRMELQGYAVQGKAPVGRWPDGWASGDFSMEFTPTRPVNAVLLEVSVPTEMKGDQTLEVSAGEWTGTEKLAPGESRTLRIPIHVESGETVQVQTHASTTWTPGNGDTRALAYLMLSCVLEQ